MSKVRKGFRFISPLFAYDVIADRRGEMDTLFYDRGTFREIGTPWISEGGKIRDYWAEFRIHGHLFRRRIREVFAEGEIWQHCVIDGTTFLIYPD